MLQYYYRMYNLIWCIIIMQSIYSLIPEPEDLLSFEPEELAGFVLEFFKSTDSRGKGSVRAFDLIHNEALRGYPHEHQKDIRYALAEAMQWLKNEGLLIQDPGQNSCDYLYITRRGQQLENAAAVEAYRKTKLLPRELLHSTLADKVWPMFLHSEYDTAVFQAFKEVEVAVRNAGEYTEEDCDVELMEKAFHPETGKLKVATQTEGEKQATFALFTGAMGLFKKPACHRNVNFSAEEASEAITFANHLFKIVLSIKLIPTAPSK